jgi:hypothetical protein
MGKRPPFEVSFFNSFASGIMESMKTKNEADGAFIRADQK